MGRFNDMIQMCLALMFYMMLAVLLGSQTSSAQSNPEDFADSSGPCACRNEQCRELTFTPSECEYNGSSKSCRVSDDCERARETFFGKYLCCTDEEEDYTVCATQGGFDGQGSCRNDGDCDITIGDICVRKDFDDATPGGCCAVPYDDGSS
ncbi:hypothetical protein M9435_001120 [Picochlorum sp. BPE23]|nr:hypothetical protein M9435_001120 [Picochlorum sp. BPE23]